MKHLLGSLIFGGVGAFLTLSVAFSAPVGRVSELQGEPAQLAYVRDEQSGFLKAQDPLFLKDRLQTNAHTTAHLLLTPDETAGIDLFLYENSALTLDQHILKSGGNKDFIGRFIKGLLKIVTRGLSDNHRLLIFTHSHLIGVRGSTLWIGHRSQKDSIASFVILEKGAKVFWAPLKQGIPDWTQIRDLPSTEKFTTILFKEDGSIDKIIPEWINPLDFSTIEISKTHNDFIVRDQTLKIFWEFRAPASLLKQKLPPKGSDFSYLSIFENEWSLMTDQKTVTASYPLDDLLKDRAVKGTGGLDCEADILNPRCQ